MLDPPGAPRSIAWRGAGRSIDRLNPVDVWTPPPATTGRRLRFIFRARSGAHLSYGMPVAILDLVDSRSSTESRLLRGGTELVEESALSSGLRISVPLRLLTVARYDLGADGAIRPLLEIRADTPAGCLLEAIRLRLVHPAVRMDVTSVEWEGWQHPQQHQPATGI